MASIQIRSVFNILVLITSSCWGSVTTAAPANADLSGADKFSSSLNKLIHSSEQNQFAVSIVSKHNNLKVLKSNTAELWDLKKHNASVQSHKKAVLEILQQGGVSVVHHFQSLATVFATVDKETLLALSKSPEVSQIGLDSGGSGQMGEVHVQTKVDQVRQTYGLAGHNVEVAILDSGIDTEHPDLIDKVVSQTCLADICSNGINDATDDHGHGTHVAGIIASNGTIAQEGIAPSVNLHIVKVLDSNNNFSSMATIAAGLDHVINHLPNVDIVNMSLGSNARFNGHCDNRESWITPLVQAIEILRSRGVMVFVSSGNDGDTAGMQAPACISSVVSVSAVYDLKPSNQTYYCTDQDASANQVACFANYSYTTDVFAPGTPIRSSWPHRQSLQLDGTSMAAPVVAGCAALLRSIYPDAEGALLETFLTDSLTNSVAVEGGLSFPILDCMEVIKSSVANLQPTPILELVDGNFKVISGSNVHAEVKAFDANDGVLDGLVTWYRGGEELHQGRILRRVFPQGRHQVTAEVTNYKGKSAELDFVFDVLANDAPVVSIVSPNQSQSYLPQTAVTLEAKASDEFDGELSDNIQWFVANQNIGSGEKLRYAFEAGSHTVVAAVSDSHDNLTEVDVVISVSAPQEAAPDKTSGGADLAMLLMALFAVFRRRRILR